MEEKLLKNLEFNKILQQISEYAATQSAADRIINIEPAEGIGRLNTLLDLVKEASDLSCTNGRVLISGYKEISDLVFHAQKGGVVREGGLLRIAADLRIAKQTKKQIIPEQYSNVSYPLLEEIADELEGIVPLEKEISRAILSEDEISDHASSALYDIRRKIRDANASIKDKLQKIVHAKESKKFLQEDIVTIRNGRYVVPVKTENKAQVPGIVHEASASGLTLFIEPLPVVNLNNQLRELEAQEQEEIERILKTLSEMVGKHSDHILNNERILILFDEVFAKAEYAIVNNHTRPEVVEVRQIHLRKAFHPLIPKETVVASDITIGEGYSQMVITGPNTGGKTVTLKTLGLCCLMAQCGLFIPAAQGSQLCLFDHIFADIGDEQSIAQSLSTFSSHMTNIVSILHLVNERSLVLLDELGAGTDPSEGAALAWAILSELKNTGSISLATTHYNEIKQYALITEGVVNASVEFDVEKLQPTYRLLIGIPGKSNAFEISRKLGLNNEILQKAESVLSRGNAEFDEIIAHLQNKLVSASQSYDEAQALAVENASINETMKIKQREFEMQKDKMLSDAAVEAKRIIGDAKRRTKEMLAEAEKEYKPDVNERSVRKAKIDRIAQDGLDDANRLIAPHRITKDANQKSVHVFKKSDEIAVPDLKAEGVILSIEGDQALVQVGSIKTRIALSKLQPKKAKKQFGYSYTGMKAKTVQSKLDIRGITANEVGIEVEKYLDDASLAGLSIVTIVHGKGNGILRKAVDRILATHPLVESYRIGGLKEGGDGATVVHLG